ncbi:dehydrodolichyl diphosphate synthase 2-like protein, partial [Tanacetum coccineum]
MAFTYSSPLKHEIMLPNITTKPCLASALHLSNLKFSYYVPPLNSQKTCATIKYIPTDLSYKDTEKTENLEKFPAGLEEGLMPKHIAFILDGNRRWAVEKGWAPTVGHSAMRMALKPLLRKCSELKIKVVSLYAFSTENWSRPP